MNCAIWNGQRALTLDKFGAEVLMKTSMCTGVPEDFPTGPRKVCFGERSAVLMWLSSTKDYAQELPFAIMLTTEPSWIAM